MKTSTKLLCLVAATSLAFGSVARAQIVTSFQSQSGYTGNTDTFASSNSKEQVFTGVSAVTQMTFNFFAGSANGYTTSETILNAVFGEWNDATASFVSGTTVSFNDLHIAGTNNSSVWSPTLSYVDSNNQTHVTGSYANASLTLDFTSLTSNLINETYGYLTDASKTYAVMLTYVDGDTNLALGQNTSGSFTYGYAYTSGVYSQYLPNDYVFSSISVVPGSYQLVPTPEPATIASIAAAVLVAGLVSLRLRQRRQLALAPVATA